MNNGSISSSRNSAAGLKTTLAVSVALALCLTMQSWAGKVPDPQGKRIKVKSDTVKKVSPEESLPGPDDFVAVEAMPVQVHVAPPAYPAAAKKADVEGAVWIKALVDKEGQVRKAIIAKDSGREVGFEEAALKAAYECRYKPAVQNEQPVAVWIQYKVVFKLEQKPGK